MSKDRMAHMAKQLFSICFRESEVLREQKRINDEIERQLSKEKLISSKEIKLLLLGTGESGKSTFIKQMRIIHGNGYCESEKQQYALIILRNIIVAIQSLVEAMHTLQIEYVNPSSDENAKIVQSIDLNDIKSPEKYFMDAIKELWNDQGVQQCHKEQKEYYISDSINYFLTNIDRLNQHDYTPSQQDILRCRVPTTGIVEYSFKIQKNNFRMVDVGGQRTERRKWIHCFENVTSVIFLAALSDYNENVIRNCNQTEDDENRLEVSVALFKVIRNNPWFQNSSMILFLNKKDLFEEKIKTVHLEDSFPEYRGPRHDAIAARKFILNQFCDPEELEDIGSRVYSHFTCATDTNHMRFVFESVKSTILEQNIKDYFY